MKKQGFTLAEVLITLSIIAIAAAIMAPAYTNLRPDKYKFKVINAYNLISNATEQLLDNPSIYFQKDPSLATTSDFDSNGNLTGQFACTGLSCTLQPLATAYNSEPYSGICKFPNLISQMANLKNITACVNTGTNHTMLGMFNNNIHIAIESMTTAPTYRITLDMDSPYSGNNCSYSSTCKSPDRFRFFVDKHGNISGEDALTKVYINDVTNTNKHQDYQNASQ